MTERNIKLMQPFVGQEELNAVQKVFESKYLTEGPVTAEFEQAFADYVDAKHGIAVTSCMTGLVLALQTLGIGKGDEVIVPSFTHPATGDCVYQVGATPVLIDVDIRTYNIDFNEIEKAINKNTKAIIPVSWGGNPIFRIVYDIGKEYGIPIIEDAACSVGARYPTKDGIKKVGSMTDISVFSFHPRKILCTGEGGMITTNNDEFARKARSLKNFGIFDGRFVYHGTNYKMSNIVAAIGLEQLKKLPDILIDRIKKANYYTELILNCGLSNDLVVYPHVTESAVHTFQSYCVYINKPRTRDKIIQDMKTVGIETQIGTYALHLEPSYENCKKAGKLINSELLYKNLLTLPLHHELTKDDQEYVIHTLKDFLEKY